MKGFMSKQTYSFRANQLRNRKQQTSQKISHYLIEQLIGKGGFGSVFTALDIHTKQKAAVKIINISGLSQGLLRKIRQEVEILQIIDHPNIVRIYETLQNDSNYLIFTELIEGKDLFQLICQNGPLKERTAAHIYHQIVCTVKYLHQRGIIHRDIKAENVLVDQKFNIKLIDFGLAKLKDPTHQSFYCGSPSYIAPQILQKKKYDGEKIDVWCLGVLLYVMLEANLPFDVKDESDQKRNKNIRSMNWHYPMISSSQAKQLYVSIFTESNLRMTIDQLLNSAFFKKHGLEYQQSCLDVLQKEVDKKIQQKAAHLTSQLLNINQQVVKLQVKKKQIGQVYAVYNLLQKKKNLQDFCLQKVNIKEKEKTLILDAQQDLYQLNKKSKTQQTRMKIKIHKYYPSPARSLQKSIKKPKSRQSQRSCHQNQLLKSKNLQKYLELSPINKRERKVGNSKQFLFIKSLKYKKLTKSQLFQQLKIGIKNTDKYSKKQYTRRKANFPYSKIIFKE